MEKNIKPRYKILGKIYFIAYLIILVYLLFFAEVFGRMENPLAERSYNIEPFKEIMRFYKYRHTLGIVAFMINVPGNVVAFIPFGFFIPIISKYKMGMLKTVFMGMLFSLGVEGIQFIVNVGSFDIDDIILNTLGSVIGYTVFLIGNIIWHRLEKNTV